MLITKRRVIWWLVVFILAIGFALGGTAWWAWRQYNATPEYWQVIDHDDPMVRADAEAFEAHVTNELSQHMPSDETWRLELPSEQINRWLASRLPDWLANQDEQLPDGVNHPMVAIGPRQVVAAVEIRLGGQKKIISLSYEPSADDDGVVVLVADRFRLGRLWLPANEKLEEVIERFTADQPRAEREQIKAVWQTFSRLRMEYDLGDGRMIKMKQLELSKRKALATLETQWVGDENE